VAAYNRIPPELVQAVVAIEDRRFFEHSGVNYARTMECAVQDAFTFHLACGASTLTQQLARTSFLSQQKTFKRKAAEFMIARRLEERFNKQQIFALYASEVNLGQSGPAPIRGFGQASHVYFDEHLNQLDLAQCALLAGMIQRPNYFNPFRHPERALARRNLVLEAMVSTGAITRVQADAAKAEPLHLVALDSLPYAPDNGASALG
jgi:penicillin-binding protein 1B